MKVFLHYEDCLEEESKMTIKLTLPKKWRSGPAQRLVDTFVEAYNKKHPDAELEDAEVHFEKKDGFEVPFDAPVESFMEGGEDLFLRHGVGKSMAALGFKPPAAGAAAAEGSAAPAAPAASSGGMAAAIAAADAKAAAAAGASSGAAKKGGPSSGANSDGRLLCKRFGCNKRFDPGDNPDTACRHHVKPPVFHETRKFWACCPDQIGWDWDSFQAIPGCSVAAHSNEAQAGQQFLGGSDVRREQELAQGTPQRLGAAPKSSLDKLSTLRKALIELGVEGKYFDAARNKLKDDLGTEDATQTWDNIANALSKRLALALKECSEE